jgi:hypothetical protein
VYRVTRAIITVWFLGAIAASLYALATVAWGRGAFKKKAKRALTRIGYGLIWPLAVLTERGRTRILTVFTKEDQGDIK